jgi:hypothetical protein
MSTPAENLFASAPEAEEVPPAATPTPEELAEQAFEAGLAEVRGDEQPAEPAQQTAPPTEPVTPEPVKFAGYTEDEIKAAFARLDKIDELEQRLVANSDKLFGTIGQLKQQVSTIGQQQPALNQVSKDAFKHLVDYFGDEALGEALANDFSSLPIGSTAPPQNVDLEALTAEISTKLSTTYDQRVQEATRAFEVKLLSLQHPDWETAKDSPEFADWQNTLSEKARDTLWTSDDGLTLIKAFDSFKAWKTQREQKAAEKQKRLEDAVPATGLGGRSYSTEADDPFMQGLNSVIKNR